MVERFTLGARPAMDPAKSETRLLKALRKADEKAVVRGPVESIRPPDESDPATDQADNGKRGIFGRRR